MSTILKPTAEQLKAILEAHSKWWCGDKDGARAYLSGADLSGVKDDDNFRIACSQGIHFLVTRQEAANF